MPLARLARLLDFDASRHRSEPMALRAQRPKRRTTSTSPRIWPLGTSRRNQRLLGEAAGRSCTKRLLGEAAQVGSSNEGKDNLAP